MSFRVLIDAPKPCSGCCIDRIANLYNQTILILLVALECDNLRHVAGSAACGRCDKRTSVSPSSGGNCAGWVVHVAARQVTPCRPCRASRWPSAIALRATASRAGNSLLSTRPAGFGPRSRSAPPFVGVKTLLPAPGGAGGRGFAPQRALAVHSASRRHRTAKLVGSPQLPVSAICHGLSEELKIRLKKDFFGAGFSGSASLLNVSNATFC